METIQTPKLENTKFEQEQIQKIASLEADLKTANETIKKLQEKIAEPRLTQEEQVRLALIDNRISGDDLRAILNKEQLEDRFQLGNIILRRVFLGDGAYRIECM